MSKTKVDKYLESMIGLDPVRVGSLLNANAEVTAETVIKQLDKFIKAIADTSGGRSAGSLKGYHGALVKSKAKRFVPIVLPSSGVKIYVNQPSVYVEAPDHHKKIRHGKGVRQHLHVFDLLDEGRKALPRKQVGGYALHNLTDTGITPRTYAAGKQRREDGVIKKPVRYEPRTQKVMYVKARVASITTGAGTYTITRPEPRVDPRRQVAVSRKRLKEDEVTSKDLKAQVSAKREFIQQRIDELRDRMKTEYVNRTGRKTIRPQDAELMKKEIEAFKLSMREKLIGPILLEQARRNAARRAANANKKAGVMYVRGGIEAVMPRRLYQRAYKQAKKSTVGKGAYLFDVVLVKNVTLK